MQGGSEYGSLTLTRFYALHVVVLPALARRCSSPPTSRSSASTASRRRRGADPREGRSLLSEAALQGHRRRRLVVVAVVFALDDARARRAARRAGRSVERLPGAARVVLPRALPAPQVLPRAARDRRHGRPAAPRGPLSLRAAAARSEARHRAPSRGRYRSRRSSSIGVGARGASRRSRCATTRSDQSFQKERVKATERAAAANRIAMAGVPPEGPLAMLKRAPGASWTGALRQALRGLPHVGSARNGEGPDGAEARRLGDGRVDPRHDPRPRRRRALRADGVQGRDALGGRETEGRRRRRGSRCRRRTSKPSRRSSRARATTSPAVMARARATPPSWPAARRSSRPAARHAISSKATET